MPKKKAGSTGKAAGRDRRDTRDGDDGLPQIDPPDLTPAMKSAGTPEDQPPTLLSFSEHLPTSLMGSTDPEEFWVAILKGEQPWPEWEQQAVLAEWWGAHVGYDSAVIAVWMAQRGIGATTTSAVVGTSDLPSAIESLQSGEVPHEVAQVATGQSVLTFERDAYGTLGPVVTDDKHVGTCIPLAAPRSARTPAWGWLAGASTAAFFFGGLMAWLGNGTESTLVAAPPTTSPAEVARPPDQIDPTARLTVTFVRPVSTYTLDVDTPLLVTRYEWSVTGPEQAECYAPAQFVWQADNPVAVWSHPHDPITHLPCAPNEDHARSVVSVRAYFADDTGIACQHQGAEATPPGEPDPCFPIQP